MNPTNKYYELYIDVYVMGKWSLDRPVNARGEWILPRVFRQGVPVHFEDEPSMAILRPGFPIDYTHSVVGLSVLNQRVVDLWDRLGILGDVQLVPARVEGQSERYFILNTLRIIRCVDEARCDEVLFWEPRHGDPERVGHYRIVIGMKIDPTLVGDAQVFRPWGWTVTLIVSERVKQAMEDEGIRGARFIEV